MIVYSVKEPLSSLWWMYGSVIPEVCFLSGICALNGVVAVYFKENYNFFVTSTSHNLVAPALGFLLILKAYLAYEHYRRGRQAFFSLFDSIRKCCVHAQGYGGVRNEAEARELVLGRTNMARHFLAMYYSLILYLRRQPLLPRASHLPLYLHPLELEAWDFSLIRPLYCAMLLDSDISVLSTKQIFSDQGGGLMSREVAKIVELIGTMQILRDVPSTPFAYFQFCNWAAVLFSLSAPAAIATHDTSYPSAAIFSFVVGLTFLGLNSLGSQLQQPFGLGPNDLPLERWGQVLEEELYMFFPFFKFRFQSFPLFSVTLEVLPPEDPRTVLRASVLESSERKSFWVAARNKILAAGRLGNRRLRRLREAKDKREAEVAEIMATRKKPDEAKADMDAVLAALAEMGGGRGKMGKYRNSDARESADKEKDKKEGPSAHEDNLAPELTVGHGNKAQRAPAELQPKTAGVKQATLLAKRFPEDENMQRMLQQMINPRIPDADKNAILALMSAEADALAAEVDLENGK